MSTARQYPITPEERQHLEAVLLGSLFLHPEEGNAVRDMVQLEDFADERHRVIYETLLTLLGTPELVTVDTLCILLLEHELERMGGVAYLSALKMQAEGTTLPIEEQAHLLRLATFHRRLNQLGETLHYRTVPYGVDDLKQIVGDLEQAKRVARQLLSPERMLLADSAPFQTELDDYLSDLENRRRQHTVLTGISTGFTDLDTITGGLQRSDLIIIAGPPSIGKTSLALSIVLHVLLKEHRSVGLFSLEAPKRQVIGRLLSMEAHLEQRLLRSLEMDDDEWKQLGEVSALLSGAKLWIDDTPNLSTAELYDKAHLLVEHSSVELLIVDYVHLMFATINGKRYENRAQEMGEISRSLKALARELNIPVLALAQVSRAYEGRPSKKPHLSDLRDGSLENDADLVLFLSVAEADTIASYQLATINIAKHRNGPCADLDVCFHTGSTRFRDLQARPRTSVPEPLPASLKQTAPKFERLQDIVARMPKRPMKQEKPKPSSPLRELPRGYVLEDGEGDEEEEADTRIAPLVDELEHHHG